MKSSELSIKLKSIAASLPLEAQVTKSTVKWAVDTSQVLKGSLSGRKREQLVEVKKKNAP